MAVRRGFALPAMSQERRGTAMGFFVWLVCAAVVATVAIKSAQDDDNAGGGAGGQGLLVC
jgi:hypothetical protein